jgi:hypothetical protein
MGRAPTCPALTLRRFVLIAAFLSACLTGCRCPRAVSTYEYLDNYDRMADQYDPLLSLVYVPEGTSFSPYRSVIIGPVDVGEQWVESRAEATSYATFFRIVLGKELRKLHKFDSISLDARSESAADPIPSAIRIDGKITKFDMGSGLLRYLSYSLFFLQGGATDLQIEGRITEAGSGKLLAEFVDRRRHLGNTAFGPSPANFTKGFAMNVTARQTAECLAEFMGVACDGLPATLEPAPQAAERANDL